jgi:hypothetical protein
MVQRIPPESKWGRLKRYGIEMVQVEKIEAADISISPNYSHL